LQRFSDEDIFKKATSEQRIILTFDLDFGEIIALSGGKMVSVILFRLHNTRTPHVLRRLESVLEESSESLGRGSIIIIVEETRQQNI